VVKSRTLVNPQLYNNKMIDMDSFVMREVDASELEGVNSLNQLLNNDQKVMGYSSLVCD
jgi:hypothetical protein